MKPDRWLATVLFTDIVGSTQKAAELGDHRWRELLQTHHALARRELRRFGGRELNTTGDGLLATFEVPERAIRCASAIRDAVRRVGLEIRAGLHTGEVEMVEKTVGGLAVHIGARVAALAAPGEVLVSGTVRDMAAGSGFEFEDRGAHLLKGVPGEWRLFAVTSAPVRLPVTGFWSRAREARLPRVLVLYIAASAVIIWLTLFLRNRFGLPDWVVPLAIVLLLIGLVVLSATAWVQSQPLTAARAEREEVPGSWDLDLKEMRRAVARGRLPHLTWGRSILGGIIAFSLLFGLAGLYVVIQDRGQTFSPREAVAEAAAPGVAVLPFTVRGPGLEVYREGMIDLVSTNLDGVAGLRAIDSRTVMANWRERVRGAGAPPLATSLEVARRTGARYALIGSVVSIGSGMRLAADVYEVESGSSIGHGQVEGSPDSVFGLVDRLSIEVLRAVLKGDAAHLPSVNLARVTTPSLPALKAYLEGEVFFRRSDFAQAIPAYHRAVEADSTFALALYRLSQAYGWTEGILSDLPMEYAERAVRFAHRLPEREALLLRGSLATDRGSLEALELLRQAARTYPDDVEAWYLLGDAHYHLGPQDLADEAESERAFSKAVDLDPSFAPAYIHLVENAFFEGDRERGAKLIEAYSRIAGGSETDRWNRLLPGLTSPDPVVRAEAVSALDTIPTPCLGCVFVPLGHPRSLAAQHDVLLALRRRPEWQAGRATAMIFYNAINRGKLREAFELADDPSMSADYRAQALYLAHDLGVPVPEDRLERELSGEARGEDPDLVVFYRGAYAADRGRWTDHAGALDRLRSAVPRVLAEGDSTTARFVGGLARALEGYGAWRRGQPDQGLQLLEAARPQVSGHGLGWRASMTVRLWIGELLVERGRPQEAVRYFTSLKRDANIQVPAALRLAEVLEAVGEFEKARETYDYFVLGWREADPELQPMVAKAQAAADRLRSVIRE